MTQHYPKLPNKYSAGALRNWLRKLPIGSIVGYAGTREACPVAYWLSDVTGKRVEVDYDHIILDGILGYETPDWVERFEKKVDKRMDGEVVRRSEEHTSELQS